MVTVEAEIGWPELEERIRAVPLLRPRDGEPVYPYEEATISLRPVDLTKIRPVTLYVLRRNLGIQEALAATLADQGHNPLVLEGALTLRGSADETWNLLPPIVEETEEDGPYILDGGHRTYRAKSIGIRIVNAVHITDIRPDCPVYAHPNEWSEVVEYDEVPPVKKKYRVDDPYNLYRDFSDLNGSTPRTA
jgi:hypothetical protein